MWVEMKNMFSRQCEAAKFIFLNEKSGKNSSNIELIIFLRWKIKVRRTNYVSLEEQQKINLAFN